MQVFQLSPSSNVDFDEEKLLVCFFLIFFADLVSFFSRLALIVQLLHYSDWR